MSGGGGYKEDTERYTRGEIGSALGMMNKSETTPHRLTCQEELNQARVKCQVWDP